MATKSTISEKTLAQYALVLDAVPEIEAKGKTAPYASMNGNMYIMMRKDGALGIRLSKEDQADFMATYQGVPFENYGSMIKDYVEVPQAVFMDTGLMVKYLRMSHAFAKTLKPKPTKKAASKKVNASPKSLVHDLDQAYKNGQIKSQMSGEVLVNYFEDGSVKSRGKLVHEKMEGKWLFNRKGGQLLQYGHYHLGVKNGEWVRYDSKGQVVYHVVFAKGKVVEKLV